MAKPKTLSQTLTGQAKDDYEAARVLASERAFGAALVRLQAAYETSKDPRLLWNIAACEKGLQHYTRAVGILKQYAADSSALVTETDRREAADLMAALAPFLANVTIDVSEADATVEIDEMVIGKTPLSGPVTIDVGPRRVRVRKEGYKEYSQTIAVVGKPNEVISVKLQRELHEGKLNIVIPPGAVATIDGQPLPESARKDEGFEVTLSAGGHTLRVTAPGMRLFEREVVVKENVTRVVAVELERENEQQLPRLRVAVGCNDTRPRGVDDGLAIYVDGSPTPLPLTGGNQRWDPLIGANVIEHVEAPIRSGQHKVLVRIPGCKPMETTLTVAPSSGADLRGALESDASLVARGPAGNPTFWRAALSFWSVVAVAPYPGRNDVTPTSEAPQSFSGIEYRPYAFGMMFQPALVARWVTAGIDLGLAKGAATLHKAPDDALVETVAALRGPSTSWFRLGIRSGVRIPLDVVAIHLGIAGGYDNVVIDVPKGLLWRDSDNAYVGAWLSIDAHPVGCDWPVILGAAVDARPRSLEPEKVTSGTISFQLGVGYQANRVCHAERYVAHELVQRSSR